MKGQSRARKKKNRISMKSWLISLTATAAAAVVVVSAVAALRGRDTLEIKEPVYIAVNGNRFQWSDGVTLLHKDDVTTLKASGTEQMMEVFPLVTADEDSVILQKSGSWNPTMEDGIYRVDYYTTICRDEQGLKLERRGKEIRNPSGFVYDNGDTYIFLEPAVLTWDDQTLELAPMTVVQASYMKSIHVYGPGAEPFFATTGTDKMIAEFADGKQVNLATDRYYKKNGSWRLLFMSLDMLQGIE